MNDNIKCKYHLHIENNNYSNAVSFCCQCSTWLCDNCLLLHNYLNQNESHKLINNIAKANLLQKIIEIRKDNRIWKYKNENNQLIINLKIKDYVDILNNIANVLKAIGMDYNKLYIDLNNILINTEEKINNNENIDIENINQTLNLTLNQLIQKQNDINTYIDLAAQINNNSKNSKLDKLCITSEISFSLYHSTNNSPNNIQHNNFNDIHYSTNIESQNDSYNNNPKNTVNDKLNNAINYQNKIDINDIKNDINTNANETDKNNNNYMVGDDMNVNDNNSNQDVNTIKSFNNKIDDLYIVLDNNSYYGEKYDNINNQNNLQSLNNDVKLINNKRRRENSKSKRNKYNKFNYIPRIKDINANSYDNTLLFRCKSENKITNNRPRSKNKIKNKSFEKNNRYITDNSVSPIIFYNFIYKHKNEQYLSLCEISENNNSCDLFKLKDIFTGENNRYYKSFSIESTKIININNKCFIIGGNSITDNDYQGNNNVFRISHQIKIEEDYYSKIINITKLNNTLYNHKYHNLIYSQNYNILFVISGVNQCKCEYTYLNVNKDILIKWKEMPSLNKPRKNGISSLINDRYIFLIGGDNTKINNYTVFDISSFLKHNKKVYWKDSSLRILSYSKINYIPTFGGIISNNNKINVLGGFRKEFNQQVNWYIDFEADKNNKKKDINEPFSKVKISTFSLKNDKFPINNYYFYGDQTFHMFNDYMFNVAKNGKIIRFSKNNFPIIFK